VEDYALADCIGTGGMGRVYLGKHRHRDHSVAIKVLSLALANDPTARARLTREARAASSLNHPNIVRVTDLDIEHDPPYLVMEYIEGESLQALVARTGTFCTGSASLCGRQVALGLQHAGEKGLVHRDIKPANLLLDRSGAVKILDLGIVRLTHEDGLTLANSKRKTILGTVDYLAPEQADDSSKVDCRADIYALGATLYFMLAGHPPFEDESPTARLARKQMMDPVRLDCLRPDVPIELAVVVARMMARNPAHRYATPQDVAQALEPWAIPVAGFPEDLFRRFADAKAAEAEKAKRDDPKASAKFSGSSIHRSATREAALEGAPTQEMPVPVQTSAPTIRFTLKDALPRVKAPRTPLTPPIVASHERTKNSAFEVSAIRTMVPLRRTGRTWIAAAIALLSMVLIFAAGYVLRPLLN
jgi:serine/threonine-protein kinase